MGINEWLKQLPFISASLCLLALGALGSCEQKVEGCLDFRASNLAIDADDACDDCCVYPSLELQFAPARFDADTVQKILRRTDTLISGAVEGFLPELGFYLYDLHLITEAGERILMQDTFTVFSNTSSPNFVYEQSVLRVIPFLQPNYTLGTLQTSARLVALEARLGLPSELRSASAEVQPRQSPLSFDSDSLLVDPLSSNYLDAAFKYQQLMGLRDSFQVASQANELIRFDFPLVIEYEASFDLLISIGFPADKLLALGSGSIPASTFVTQILGQAQVIQVSVSR